MLLPPPTFWLFLSVSCHFCLLHLLSPFLLHTNPREIQLALAWNCSNLAWGFKNQDQHNLRSKDLWKRESPQIAWYISVRLNLYLFYLHHHCPANFHLQIQNEPIWFSISQWTVRVSLVLTGPKQTNKMFLPQSSALSVHKQLFKKLNWTFQNWPFLSSTIHKSNWSI